MKEIKAKILELIEEEEHRKTLWRILIAMLAVTVAADFLVERHAEFAWIFPGFAAVYGFASCIFIIVFSKWIGHKWLMRDEDYWDRLESGSEAGSEAEKAGSEAGKVKEVKGEIKSEEHKNSGGES